MARADIRQLLGGLTTAAFLARYWHRAPLLIRDAAPAFAGVITRDELFALAAQEDVASRLVRRGRQGFTLAQGPFSRSRLARLPARDWTLLVQGVNLHSDAADALLRRFAFIPYARLDDVMVSYAAPGGGVGPHVDSYDVFLLQATGRRRWRYGRQADHTQRPHAPLKILRHFAPQHAATLEPGDMLYLPPDVAHEGTAVDECVTYSIGFRAPLHQEIAEAFVDHLRDALDIPGRYADPDLRASRHPARIDPLLRRRFAKVVAQIRQQPSQVARFVGRYLSEPRPEVVFTQPSRATRAGFARRSARGGVRLDRRTQLFYDDAYYYLNGDDAPLPLAAADRTALKRLADRRALTGPEFAMLAPATIDVLYDWHRHGYLAPP
jgi:50S ribosomal protein L16 3-hydroxylase